MRRRVFGTTMLALAGAVASAGCVQGGLSPGPGFVELIRRASPAVVGVGDERGVVGTGFLLVDTHFVVTAAHMLRPAQASPDVF